jgi:hypothetical protein
VIRLQPSEIAAALEALAARLGIPVRHEAMDRAITRGRSRGGLCRLRDQPMILVDGSLDPTERVAILAEALAHFDLDGIYLPPEVRASIRAHGTGRVLEPRPLARARPGRKTE